MISRREMSRAACAAMLAIYCTCVHAAGQDPTIDATPFLGDHYPVRRTSFPGGVVGFSDVTYEVLPGFRPLTLDVYRAARTSKPRPLILYIHGGGWTNGHARQSGAFDDWPSVLASLASRGYTVASLNYRLSGEAPFPAAIQDVKTAIRFLRAHAAEYAIDPGKAMTWGGSAGGHLAALAAVTCGVTELDQPAPPNPEPAIARVQAQSDCVQGAVTWYGLFDLAAVAVPGSSLPATLDKFLACGGSGCAPEKLALASPTHYVNHESPPFLLIHGAVDKVVDPAQSTHFKQAMSAAGASAQLLVIPGVDHSFIGKSQAETRAASLQALNRTFKFFDATFKSTAGLPPPELNEKCCDGSGK